MRPPLHVATAVAVVTFLSLSASAQVFDESGDAGDVTATANDASMIAVTTINGAITGSGDADMFRVFIQDPGTFSATTEPGGGSSDTRLFLFDSDGVGICYNDDTPSAAGFWSTISAGDPNCSYSGAGYYFIGVTHYNMMAENSSGVNLFCEVDTADPGPGTCDDFEATIPVETNDPVAQWSPSGTPLTRDGSYTVTISGAVASASEPEALPAGYAFDLRGSNPFTVRTRFDLQVAVSQEVRVVAYDALGREAVTLFEGAVAAGSPQVVAFESGTLRSGTYIVRAHGEAFDVVQPVTVLR